jgi:hypothetical protein
MTKTKVKDGDHASAEMTGETLIMYPLWRREGDFWYPEVPPNHLNFGDKPILVIPALHMEELLAERVVLRPAGGGLSIAMKPLLTVRQLKWRDGWRPGGEKSADECTVRCEYLRSITAAIMVAAVIIFDTADIICPRRPIGMQTATVVAAAAPGRRPEYPQHK